MSELAYTTNPEGAARPWLQRKSTLRIGTPDDAYEREADRAADAVVSGRGLSSPGLSLSRIPVTQVQREDDAKPKSDEDKYKEAAQKLGEAFLETDVGKKLKEQAENDPLVKGAKEAVESFIGTLPGKIITGAAAAGAVATLAAAHKELPAQIPEIPLDKITPGLKVKVTYEGPVDNPSKAMITFSYTEQLGGAKKPGKTKTELQREENARMALEMAKFRAGLRYAPGTPEAKQQEAEEEALKRAAFSGVGKLPDFGSVKTFPGLAQPPSALSMQFPTPSYGFKPKSFSLLDEELKLKPKSETSEAQEQEKKKKEEGAPVQRKAAGDSTPDAAPPLVNDVLAAPGRPLDAATRGFMEARFGHDFSRVRVHMDAQAMRSAHAVNARAYTIGHNIVFATGQYAPNTSQGIRLLAHELTHVLQQDGGYKLLQCDFEDPARFSRVHERLFVRTPSGGAPRPWINASGTDHGTAGEIIDQFKDALREYIRRSPLSVGGTVETRTTEAEAETDAIEIDRRIRTRFPQITTVLSESELRGAVNIISPTQTSDPQFLHQWLANRLGMWTDINEYNIDESDTRFQQMLTDLLDDSYAGPRIRTLASRQAGFTEGEARARQVFIHRGANVRLRRLILIHEITHMYVGPGFNDWVSETNAMRFYEEGFTEYLARLVMTGDESGERSNYQSNWEAVRDNVAAFVPDDDIARAYFLGEVWRLESRSDVSRRLFAEQVGLRAGAPRSEEIAASRTGPGINETVAAGRHYRFLNLSHNRAEPKPEHVAFFGDINRRYLVPSPAVQARFVGHASSPGTLQYNLDLSRRRALAFYQMARDAGVTERQLADADNPPHFGESRPTAENEDVHGRAFNRRVELILVQSQAMEETQTEPEE